MRNSIFITTAILTITFANAQQTKDSLQQKAAQGIKEKFPRTRKLNFEYGQSVSRNFDSELFEQKFQKGEKYYPQLKSLPLRFFEIGRLVFRLNLKITFERFCRFMDFASFFEVKTLTFTGKY